MKQDSTGALVRMVGVHKHFRRDAEVVHALVDVDLQLRSGEVTGLVGPSGSGKSTLLSVLCGWEEPDSGRLEWATGLGVTRADRVPWDQLAVVPQALGLLEDLSVRENIALPGKLMGRPDPERVEQLLVRLGLDGLADRPPAETSLGQQQRAAVARALLLRPRILLADEPSTHQDSGWSAVVFTALRESLDDGATVLLATHDPEGFPYADRILEMRDGALHLVAA